MTESQLQKRTARPDLVLTELFSILSGSLTMKPSKTYGTVHNQNYTREESHYVVQTVLVTETHQSCYMQSKLYY